jgi:hypothetical protein
MSSRGVAEDITLVGRLPEQYIFEHGVVDTERVGRAEDEDATQVLDATKSTFTECLLPS